MAKDAETGETLAEITEHGEEKILIPGGRGGLGNVNFKSATNQTPRYAQPGEPSQEKWIILELKVLADVGLVGLPNAGKSTLLSVISAAKPKIGDYPFTTMVPSLGVVPYRDNRSFIMADIPGIIDGAAEGAGLGLQFLRHLSRTRLLLHVVDCGPHASPLADIRSVITELGNFNEELAGRERWLILNKMDLLDEEEAAMQRQEIIQALDWQGPVYAISALAKTGFADLVYRIMDDLESKKRAERLALKPADDALLEGLEEQTDADAENE
jgi:GTP-binding protein